MLSFKQLRDMLKIPGSGALAQREHLVSSFTRLHLSVTGTVRFVVGEEEKVTVEADDNLLDYVAVVNSGRTLYITSENKLRSPGYTALTVTVFLRQLSALNVSADGDMTCPDLLHVTNPLDVVIRSNGNAELHVATPALTLNIAANGAVVLGGEAEEAQIKVASNGDLDARRFRAGRLKVRNGSNGNVRVWASQTIMLHHGGNGTLLYGGPARLLDVNQRGSGAVRHVADDEA